MAQGDGCPFLVCAHKFVNIFCKKLIFNFLHNAESGTRLNGYFFLVPILVCLFLILFVSLVGVCCCYLFCLLLFVCLFFQKIVTFRFEFF